MSQLIVPLPWVLQAPRSFSGRSRSVASRKPRRRSAAFQDGLSFFRNAYDQFAGYRAAIIRLHGLVIADEEASELPELMVGQRRGTVEVKDVEVRTPDGKQLIDSLDLRLSEGDTLVITGPSGSGKTTLLRSLAQLWPYGSGTSGAPMGLTRRCSCPSCPIAAGRLRAVVCYPSSEGASPTTALRADVGQSDAAAPG